MKVLLTVFFDCNGVMRHESLSQGRMVNKEYHLEVMRQLCETFRQKCTELRKNQSWIMHHDNAPALTSMLVPKFLVKNKIVIMPQPTYSTDLVPADFFLFLKSPIKGNCFAAIKEIKEKSQQELWAIPKKRVWEVFRGLEKTYITSEGGTLYDTMWLLMN